MRGNFKCFTCEEQTSGFAEGDAGYAANNVVMGVLGGGGWGQSNKDEDEGIFGHKCPLRIKEPPFCMSLIDLTTKCITLPKFFLLVLCFFLLQGFMVLS